MNIFAAESVALAVAATEVAVGADVVAHPTVVAATAVREVPGRASDRETLIANIPE